MVRMTDFYPGDSSLISADGVTEHAAKTIHPPYRKTRHSTQTGGRGRGTMLKGSSRQFTAILI